MKKKSRRSRRKPTGSPKPRPAADTPVRPMLQIPPIRSGYKVYSTRGIAERLRQIEQIEEDLARAPTTSAGQRRIPDDVWRRHFKAHEVEPAPKPGVGPEVTDKKRIDLLWKEEGVRASRHQVVRARRRHLAGLL